MKLKHLFISSLAITYSTLLSAAEINIDSIMTANVQPWLKNELNICTNKVKFSAIHATREPLKNSCQMIK